MNEAELSEVIALTRDWDCRQRDKLIELLEYQTAKDRTELINIVKQLTEYANVFNSSLANDSVSGAS